MLARKAVVVGITEFVSGRAAQADALAVQRDGDSVTIQIADDELPGASLQGKRQGYSLQYLEIDLRSGDLPILFRLNDDPIQVDVGS